MSLSTHTTPLIISNPFDLPLNMTQYWEPGTQYNHGDVVEYDGHRYKIIQPHFSQSDWTPPITPALWGRLQDADHGHNENQHHGQYNQQQPIQQQPPTYQQPHDQGQLQQGYPSSDQKVEHAQEEKKHWYDDDKLKVGAGLVAGAALLGGGLFAYKEHEEEKKNIQGWLNDARTRTEHFNRNGPSGPATWVLTQGRNIPQGAIEVSEGLYICRAYHEGGRQIGKASPRLKKGAAIGYKHDEIDVETYEILLGDMSGLRWVPVRGKVNVSSLGHRPVEGGNEDDGSPLYVAQALYKGTVYPGKASEKLDGAYIPYDGTEKNVKEYRVLCYN